MKQICLVIALSLTASPLLAQEEDRGLSLMERGAQLFFEGLMKEVDPALKELEGMVQELEPSLRSFAEEMGPNLRDLMDSVEDWSAYHPPEVLDNGDIILRKKSPAEQLKDKGGETGEIEI